MENENYYLTQINNIYDFEKVKEISASLLPSLLKHFSNEPTNFNICLKLNKYFFNIDNKIIPYILHFGINKYRKYIKHKKIESEEKKELWLIPHLQIIYNWSEKEVIKNFQIIEMFLQNEGYKEWLDNQIGFNQEECSMLGINYKTPIIERIEKQSWW